MPHDETPDISAADWLARQQRLNDAQVSAIHRNLGLRSEPAPQVRCGESGEAWHQKKVYFRPSRPVVSDRGEWFRSAADAAAAVGLSKAGGIYDAIKSGGRAVGRTWKYASGVARKRPANNARPVVDDLGNRYPTIKAAAAAAAEAVGAEGGWVCQAIQRGWRVRGRRFEYADAAKEAA